MLLLLGDVHSRFEAINAQIRDFTRRTGQSPEAVLQLGDMGFYRRQLAEFFDEPGRTLDAHVHFIDGNHEDFARLDSLAKRYAGHFTHVKRCSTHTFVGLRFLLLGGAAYMDSINTPYGAVITPRDIENCLTWPPDSIDVVVSHDCPSGIGVSGKEGFEECGPPGFAGSRSILERFRPRLWLFAHYHEWFEATEGDTRFQGLAPAWEGYAILDQDGILSVVPNPVEETPALHEPAAESWGARLARKYLGLTKPKSEENNS